MKKVILLLVAVMISSLSMASGDGHNGDGPKGYAYENTNSNAYGDATISQVGDRNKSLIDQTQATGGGWYYEGIGSGTDASIWITGDDNQASIVQVGYKNVAGQDLNLSGSACGGFSLENNGGTMGGTVEFNTCKIEVPCNEPLAGTHWSKTVDGVKPGIEILSGEETSVNNVASIMQTGDFLLAGIQITGSDNEALIDQNSGGTSHYSTFDKAAVKIVGDDNSSVVHQGGESNDYNEAYVSVNGDRNHTFVLQGWEMNKALQDVTGDDNTATIKQRYGNENSAIQVIDGDHINLVAEQEGSNNRSYQEATGSQHNSMVFQDGNCNQAVTLQ